MNRARLENDIIAVLRNLRANGGGTARLSLIDGRPALSASGIPVLVPADLSDREIAGQCQTYADQLMEGRGAA